MNFTSFDFSNLNGRLGGPEKKKIASQIFFSELSFPNLLSANKQENL